MKSLSLLIEEETSYKFGKLGAQLGFKGLLFLLNTCYFFTGGRWQLFKGLAIPRNTRKSKLERQYQNKDFEKGGAHPRATRSNPHPPPPPALPVVPDHKIE